MKRLLLAVVLCILVSSLASGCLYAKIKVPLDSDVSETELGDKVGKSSCQSALWLFPGAMQGLRQQQQTDR